MIQGSEKYGTEIMKDEECLLFLETGIENGCDIKEMISDMRMIDSFMQMKRLHLAVHGQIKRTSSGNFRKGSDLATSLMKVIEGRANNAF